MHDVWTTSPGEEIYGGSEEAVKPQYALHDLKARIDGGDVAELLLLQPLVRDGKEYMTGVAVRVFRTTPGYAWVLEEVTTCSSKDLASFLFCHCEDWETLLEYIEGVQTESHNWTINKPPTHPNIL
ncbi:MAG TPA: hypothetical protein VFB12_16670 [Ktedonobacteraceae bacterium]|nr:hypothetical protein [Ktedonobacteraceae bacterium]